MRRVWSLQLLRTVCCLAWVRQLESTARSSFSTTCNPFKGLCTVISVANILDKKMVLNTIDRQFLTSRFYCDICGKYFG